MGSSVTTLDLYDLLLHGDTSGDRQLLPGDVIFIPPIGPTVSVYGAVRRPAIYELKRRKNRGAGGRHRGRLDRLMPIRNAAQLERILPSQLA